MPLLETGHRREDLVTSPLKSAVQLLQKSDVFWGMLVDEQKPCHISDPVYQPPHSCSEPHSSSLGDREGQPPLIQAELVPATAYTHRQSQAHTKPSIRDPTRNPVVSGWTLRYT